jgi:hypothetical protein
MTTTKTTTFRADWFVGYPEGKPSTPQFARGGKERLLPVPRPETAPALDAEDKPYKLTLDYPLFDSFDFPIYGPNMTRVDLMRAIQAIYQSIYDRPIDYGIWGHGINDLVIEHVLIDHQKRTIKLFVGS